MQFRPKSSSFPPMLDKQVFSNIGAWLTELTVYLGPFYVPPPSRC